jgi:glycosyltransferase involved in cell wall biosynthesis
MSAAWPGPRLRVALVSGLLIKHDAISNSVRLKLDLLRRLRDTGSPIEVTAFVLGTEEEGSDVIRVGGVTDLAIHPRFHGADVYVFEFGIYYQLFDAVFLLADPSRVLAVYHNITPLELVVEPSARAAVERAMVQKHNLVQAGRIICDSELNRDDLVEFGIEPERLTVHHLPPARPPRPRRSRSAGDPVELTYLGRIVRPKGILDLLAAVEQLHASGVAGFSVSVIGSPLFSEPEVVAELEQAPARGLPIRYLGELDDDAVAEHFAGVDALVVPSYHEGYCVPVVEAYAAGCQVVAYDAGNLPHVVGGGGQVVATGDVAGLAAAMQRVVESAGSGEVPVTGGWLTTAEWRDLVGAHLADYTAERYEQAFLDELLVASGSLMGAGR